MFIRWIDNTIYVAVAIYIISNIHILVQYCVQHMTMKYFGLLSWNLTRGQVDTTNTNYHASSCLYCNKNSEIKSVGFRIYK